MECQNQYFPFIGCHWSDKSHSLYSQICSVILGLVWIEIRCNIMEVLMGLLYLLHLSSGGEILILNIVYNSYNSTAMTFISLSIASLCNAFH